MTTWRDIGVFVGVGIVLTLVATVPLFHNSSYISNHGDVNRGLIFSGVAKSAILDNNLPLWNPYICAGYPLLADIESWFLDPWFFATLFADPVLAMKLRFALTLFTAFVGFAVMGRGIMRLENLGSITFALVVTFSGYYSQHLAEGYYVWVAAAWIPWLIISGIKSLTNYKFIPVAGLMLACMFGAGSMHMVVYSLLFLGLYFLVERSTRFKKKNLIFISIIVFFAALASIKLLPVLSVLVTSESRLGFVPPFSFLPEMLLTRGVLPAIEHNGSLYRFGEFGNYIGYVSVALMMVTMFATPRTIWKKHRALLIVSGIMLILSFISLPVTHGYISRVTDLFRMPSRLMIFPMIGIALLVAHGLQTLRSWKGVSLTAYGVCVLLAVDLISNDRALFSRSFTVPLPEIHVESKFMRVKHSYTTPDQAYYRAAYLDYMEYRGVNDLCRFYQHAPATSAINGSDKKKPDRGEVYVAQDGAGTVTLLRRTDNDLQIHVNVPSPSTILVNMNYYPGWKTMERLRVHEQDGLVAVDVPGGETTFTLLYHPRIVDVAAFISVAALVVACSILLLV